MHASPPVDTQQQDTYFVVAHFHYVLFGGSIFGLFAGIYYWFPKVTGRMLNETLGKVQFVLFFVGFNMTFGPMHFLGVDGMPRRIYTYPADMGWNLWNMVATLGAYTIGLGVLLFIYNALRTLATGERVGDDPWDARTLEWAVASPPPHYNFAAIPVVTARDAFWVQKYPALAEHGGVASHDGQGDPPGEDPPELEEHGHIHLPDPSYWPIVAGSGLLVAGSGVLFWVPLIPVGLFVVLASATAWSLEPVNG
jgi:cytochrome c oxidase subunit 1